MTLSDAINVGGNVADLIGLACLVLGHSPYARMIAKRVSKSSNALNQMVCQNASARELDIPLVMCRGGKLMLHEKITTIEPIPIDDIFVTGVLKIEHFHGLVRYWLYVDEGPIRVVKCKVVMPLASAQSIHRIGDQVLTIANQN